MKRKKLWVAGLLLLGITFFIFINRREMINAYFSTVKLQFLVNYAESYYLYDMNEDTGLEGIYSGYLQGLGSSMTYYLKEDDLKAAKIQAKGEYFGTGLKLMWNLDGHAFTIIDIVKGSAAERENLQVGDQITEIEGIPVLPANKKELIEKISGNKEKVTKYVIKRDDKSWQVELIPTEVMIEDLTSEMIDDVLYIKLNTVKEGTSQKIKELIEQADFTECKGLILDIRNLVTQQIEEVAKISDLFLDGGIAFKVRTKSDGVKAFEMNEDAYEMPLVIITNSSTLGGAEALVLALKERATLLGSNTGGISYVQKIISFEDHTGMSVASGKICDRYGKDLEKEGISPDIRLYLDEEEILAKLENGYLSREEDHYLQQALILFQ